MPTFKAPDGATLYYTDEGEGRPILALAGLTRNCSDFDFVAPHLKGDRLIRLDYRGRGRSEWTGPATYTIPNEAADALALLDHLEMERTAILGTSRGGLIAMVLATTAKSRLSGVCLNDVGPVLEPSGLSMIMDYIGRNPKARTLDEAAVLRATLLPGFSGVPTERWRADASNQYSETPDGLVIKYDPTLRDAIISAGAQTTPDLWPLFDAFQDIPLALVRGENSNILSEKTARDMHQRRPDMIWATVPDRGHVPFLDEPESLQVLRQWTEVLT